MAEMVYQEVVQVAANARIDNVLQGKRIENLPDGGVYAIDVYASDNTDGVADTATVRMEMFIGNRAPIENSIVLKSALIGQVTEGTDAGDFMHDDRVTPDDMVVEALPGYGGERLKLSLQNTDSDPRWVIVKIVVNPAIV